MTTESLSLIVVDILGRYIVDNGATLLKEAGQAAAQAASQLYEFVLSRLKADPVNARNAERFQQNPEGYQVPIADAVTEKLASDPNFSAQLLALFEAYKKAAGSNEKTIMQAGAGAFATQGGIAAGAGGVAVGGNVRGNVSIRNTENKSSSGGIGP